MYDWATMYVHQRGEELRRDREKHLLIQEALAARGKRDPIYAPVLAEVGRRLAEWGSQLEERYAGIDAQTSAAR
jgi:hypothetical protein